jgi:predicted ATP-grasp superfamily ATP-dependent carboligase
MIVLGPKEESIRISANKWLTHLALGGKVPQPRAWRKPPRARRKILAKPVDGVGCDGIGFLKPGCEMSGMIFQEFIDGEHASCCLLMSENGGTALSVNRQDIAMEERFEYMGGEVPLKHRLAEKCVEVAENAARALNLYGYCGADLVLGDVPYFIELNPRVTTSFVALTQVIQANLAELLVDALVEGNVPSKPKLRGFSSMKIPRARSDIEIVANLEEFREIPELVAPPLAPDGKLRKGSPVFLAVGSGSSLKTARRRLFDAIAEVLAVLEVDENAIAWR